MKIYYVGTYSEHSQTRILCAILYVIFFRSEPIEFPVLVAVMLFYIYYYRYHNDLCFYIDTVEVTAEM
jgi:hypothetical protein